MYICQEKNTKNMERQASGSKCGCLEYKELRGSTIIAILISTKIIIVENNIHTIHTSATTTKSLITCITIEEWNIKYFDILLVGCPSRITGKSKILKIHSHTYYPIRPTFPQQRTINQPTKLPTDTCLLHT